MADILLRDVPEQVVAALDAQAAALGVSRKEFLRRLLAQTAFRLPTGVTVEGLRRLAETFGDLEDPEVARVAWS